MTSKVEPLLDHYPEYRYEIEQYYLFDPIFAEICHDIADLEETIRQLEQMHNPARTDILEDARALREELHGEAIRTIQERLAAEQTRTGKDEARRGGEH